jgi:hypothetical protein
LMYIHLSEHEQITFARAALYVREFSTDSTGVDFVL